VSRKTVIQNWRCSIQLLLENDDEQNPKFGAKNRLFIYTIFFNVGQIVSLVETKNIEIILVIVYIMSEWMFVVKKYKLCNKNEFIPPPKGLGVLSNCSCNRRGFVYQT